MLRIFHAFLETIATDWTDSAYVATENNGEVVGFFCYSVNIDRNAYKVLGSFFPLRAVSICFIMTLASVLGGVRQRIASVSVHTLNIPEEHLAADAAIYICAHLAQTSNVQNRAQK